MPDHLIVAKESVAGTFVAPTGDMVSGLMSMSTDPGDTRIERRESGRSRAVISALQGIHSPSGSMETILEPDNMGLFLLAAGNNDNAATQEAATSAYHHGFAQDDSLASTTLSLQIEQIRSATTTAINMRGVYLSGVTFNIQVDGQLRLSFDYIAMEETTVGGTFPGNGDTSAAAVAVSYGTVVREFIFSDLVVKYGITPGTFNATEKYFDSISGGTILTDMEDVEISVNQNFETRHVLGDRYMQEVVFGNREISMSATIRNDTPVLTFYDKFIAGTQEGWHFLFSGVTDAIESGHTFEFEITIPLLDYTEAAVGDLSSDHGARNITLGGNALYHSASAQEINYRLKNTVTTAY